MKKLTQAIFVLIVLAGSQAWAGKCLEGDCRNGQGVFLWDDGSRFIGGFVNGEPDGEGIFVSKEQQRYKIVYKDGRPSTAEPLSEEDEYQKQIKKEALRYNEAGNVYFQKGDYLSAIHFYNKAITLWPDNKVFHDSYWRAKSKIKSK